METSSVSGSTRFRDYFVSWIVAFGVAGLAAWLTQPPELPSFALGFSFLFVFNAFFDRVKRTVRRVVLLPVAAGFSVVGIHHVIGHYMFQM